MKPHERDPGPPAGMTAGPDSDYAAVAVPLSERRGPLTMGLLWVTMVTGFPCVLAGFQWHKAGLSLQQVLFALLLCCVLLMLYCLPSCLLGARTGLAYAVLCRRVFGTWGSYFVSFNIFLGLISWYGLTAVFLAQGLLGLYQIPIAPLPLTALLGALMAVNNIFGFRGVANFARYLAGPLLLLWILHTFYRASSNAPVALWAMPQQVTTAQALTIVSSFIIGCSVWGNEADFWRFSRPTRRHVALPLLAALVIGAIIFPTAGWLLAHKTGITDLAGVAGLLNSYVANYLSVLPALILIVPNFAVNDSNLYSATNAAQNLFAAPRRVLVAGVAAIGSLIAVLLYQSAQNFQIVASLSSVLLPPATIIILTEAFFFGSPPRKEDWLEHLSEAADARKFRWPAVAALAAGCGVGLLTTGILPGTEALHRGIPALHACGTSFLAYVILRRLDPQPLFRKTPLE